MTTNPHDSPSLSQASPSNTSPTTATVPQQQLGLGECCSWVDQQKAIAQLLPNVAARSPLNSRLLLAQFDAHSITVYQAYKPSISRQAVATETFCDSDFSFSRMTWIKPNFSWMMYRSGWASKRNQETILAIRLTRTYFDQLLQQAVSSSWDGASYGSREEWHKALRASKVVVQWDPDHHLVTGAKLPYRVIQLGIRAGALEGFRGFGIVSITDITTQAKAMQQDISTASGLRDAQTPWEKRYPISGSMKATLGIQNGTL
ncbi:unnamed protein product [Chondrus crispus]|uniref:DUF4291 domain-containing protein n=1 Tax=Chondrus crispus TaxID=2769 RepID=R7Q6M0_CHOCR|nr:unnamed protein product [Chondrus crispus]CDF33006.1 unnamed protein product [Chondrus crispus]|eukprot:XP_005712809.1 unnamed protein product [Chondrus crispus]